MSKNQGITVAAYLTQQIAVCDKPQKEIAREVGYDKPNMITMIKQGKTKLPVNKVAPMAKSLGVDPIHLLRIVLREYLPDTWLAVEELAGKSLVSESELKLIELVRERYTSGDLILTENRTAKLTTLFDEWSKEDQKLATASLARANAQN